MVVASEPRREFHRVHAASVQDGSIWRGAARQLGLFSGILESTWRRQRLCILCYHGVSIRDEHLWNHHLFISPERFRRRMELLAHLQCSVLGLEDALLRLSQFDLPPRSVVITFDDGFHDFLARAHPLLAEHGFPATVYLTTYYSEHNLPVFRLMCSYLLRLRRGCSAVAQSFAGRTLEIRTATQEDRSTTMALIDQEVDSCRPTAQARQAFLEHLAESLDADLAALSAEKILHLLTPDEARMVSAQGVDVQLHTHRHRTPRDQRLFAREVLDNRASIRAATGTTPHHFCYPSGVHHAEFPTWLRNLGVASATTCESGLCTPGTDPLLLPRYLDQEAFSDLEFESWVTGAAAIACAPLSFV